MPVPGGSLSKPELRRRLLGARAGLGPDERAAADVARAALLAPLLRGRVASYEPFGSEPVPPVVPGALVPVLLPDRDLAWRAPDGSPGRVEDCDVVLVPAVACDRSGVRLGRGGGSYDRALSRARGLVVALLHEGELLDALPAEPHDVPVDVVALPSGLFRVADRMGP